MIFVCLFDFSARTVLRACRQPQLQLKSPGAMIARQNSRLLQAAVLPPWASPPAAPCRDCRDTAWG